MLYGHTIVTCMNMGLNVIIGEFIFVLQQLY